MHGRLRHEMQYQGEIFLFPFSFLNFLVIKIK
jgi:hypothetical protein